MTKKNKYFLKTTLIVFSFFSLSFLAGLRVVASQKEPTPEDLVGASLIEVDKEYGGELAGKDKGVFYKIPVASGHELKIYYHNSDTWKQPVELRYYRSDGKKISETVATVDGFLSYTPGKTADNDRYSDNMVYFQIYFDSATFKTTYSFKVTMKSKTDIGLEEDVPDKLENAVVIVPGDYPSNFLDYSASQGKYYSDDEKDFYKFNLAANKALEIKITPNSNLSLFAEIFDEDRTSLIRKNTNNAGQILNLNYINSQMEAKDLYLSISCGELDCFGSYQFSLTTSDAPQNNQNINNNGDNANPLVDINNNNDGNQNTSKPTEPGLPVETIEKGFMTLKWFTGSFLIFTILIMILGFALTIFWLLMLIDAVKREFAIHNQKILWILLIVFTGWIGALVYYFLVKKNNQIDSLNSPPPTPPASGLN